MTIPALPVVDVADYCCADPAIGGCGHHITGEHDPIIGECGVVGCGCQSARRHVPGCLHFPYDDQAAAVTRG